MSDFWVFVVVLLTLFMCGVCSFSIYEGLHLPAFPLTLATVFMVGVVALVVSAAVRVGGSSSRYGRRD